MRKLTMFVAALAAFAMVDAKANDFLKVLESVSKAVDTVQDASLKNVQVSTAFADGAATGVSTVFPTATKTLYVSYTVAGSASYLPVQVNWYKGTTKIYTQSGTLPKSGTAGEYNLSPKNGVWPVGEYKVDFVVKGSVLGSASFTISDSQSSSTAGVWGDSTATAVVPPGIKDIVISTGFSSGKAIGSAVSFPTQGTKTLYASFTATGASSGVKIQAIWYREVNGAFSAISTMNSTLPAADANGEFHLSVSGDSWPAGGYKVEFTINGAVAGSVQFKVEESNSSIWHTTAATTTTTTTTAVTATTEKASAAQSKLDDFFSK